MSTTRTVTVFGTRGKKVKIDTDVTSWGELRPLLEEEGVSFNNMAATESVGRTTLEHKDAILPETNFTLFLRAKKTKSGVDVDSMSYRDMKTTIASEGDSCKEFLNNFVDGKNNWTRLSSSEMRDGLKAYFEQKGDTSEAVEEIEAEEVEEVIEETSTNETEEVLNPLDKVKKAKDLLQEVCDELEDEDICDRISDIQEDIEGLLSDVEESFDPEAAAAKKAEEEEDERLEEEFRNLNEGFNF